MALPARGGPLSTAAAPVTFTRLAPVASSGGLALSVVETEGPPPRCRLGPRGSQDALWSQGTGCGRGEATGIGPGGWFLFLCYLDTH